MEPHKPDSRWWLAAWLAALLLVILGAKLWIIQVYGSPLPYWDQWDEAKLVFKPWLEGHLTWGALFAAHNEHRILFTRLLDLLELRLNGQWDPGLQMVVNALLHAGFAGGLAFCLWVFLGKRKEGLICVLLAPFFALPFAAENTIRGFQSQEYFLCLFSVAAITGLGLGTPRQARWWVGLAAAILALFTMASGLLAALTVAGLAGLRWLKNRRLARGQFIVLGCGLAVFIAGWALRVTVEQDKPFQAQSLVVFLNALMRHLAWPFPDHPLMCLITCLPLAVVCWQYFRSPDQDLRAPEFILALGLWGVLQAAALAFGRAALGDSSRYMDTLAIIPIAGLAGWLVIAQRANFGRVPRAMVMPLAVVWAGCCFWGLCGLCGLAPGNRPVTANYLQQTKRLNLIEEANVRAYVATRDARYLLGQPPVQIPYWDGQRLIDLLLDSNLAAILPPVCRPPLTLAAATNSDAAFVPGGCPPELPGREFAPVWGNYTTNGTAAAGRFISETISPTRPEFAMQLCCGSDTNGIRVQLVEQSSGLTTEVRPKAFGRWETVTVAAPKNPFRVEITGNDRNSLVAVGEIQELGRWSVGARWVQDRAAAALLDGLGLYLLLLGRSVIRHRAIAGEQGFPEFAAVLAAVMALWLVWLARNFDVSAFDCRLHKELGSQFAAEGKPASAELHFREALWRQPDDPVTFVRLGDVILHDPRLTPEQARAEARVDYQTAWHLAPASLEIQKRLRETDQTAR